MNPISENYDCSFQKHETKTEIKKIEKIEEAEIDSPFAVMSLMDIAKRKGWKPELLDYKNSGDITGDKDKVVGYAAIAFC